MIRALAEADFDGLIAVRNAGFEQREYYPNDVRRQTGEVCDSMLMTKMLV